MKRRNLNFEIECFKDINNHQYIHPFYKSNQGHLFLSGDRASMIDYVLKNMIRDVVSRYYEHELKIIIYSTSIEENSFLGLNKYLKVPIIKKPDELIEQLKKIKKKMMNRYKSFRQNKSRDIKTFNTKALNLEINHRYMPYILLVIHEMPSSKEHFYNINSLVYDIVQQSRAAGIHVILSTILAKETMSPLLKYNMNGIIFRIESILNAKTLLEKRYEKIANELKVSEVLVYENAGKNTVYNIGSLIKSL